MKMVLRQLLEKEARKTVSPRVVKQDDIVLLQTRPYELRKGFVRLSPEVTTAPSYTKRRKAKLCARCLVGGISHMRSPE